MIPQGNESLYIGYGCNLCSGASAELESESEPGEGQGCLLGNMHGSSTCSVQMSSISDLRTYVGLSKPSAMKSLGVKSAVIRLTGKFNLKSEMGATTQLYFLHAGKRKGWKTFKNQGRVVLDYQWLMYILCTLYVLRTQYNTCRPCTCEYTVCPGSAVRAFLA